jgi:hypothetical protein
MNLNGGAVEEPELFFAFPVQFEDRVLTISADERQILVKDLGLPGLVSHPIPGSELAGNLLLFRHGEVHFPPPGSIRAWKQGVSMVRFLLEIFYSSWLDFT